MMNRRAAGLPVIPQEIDILANFRNPYSLGVYYNFEVTDKLREHIVAITLWYGGN